MVAVSRPDQIVELTEGEGRALLEARAPKLRCGD